MSDIVFSAEQVAETLGCTVDALRDIPGFPRPVESTGADGEVATGYGAADVAQWVDRLTSDARRRSRAVMSPEEAARLLGVESDYLGQAATPGMPRYDRHVPSPVFLATSPDLSARRSSPSVTDAPRWRVRLAGRCTEHAHQHPTEEPALRGLFLARGYDRRRACHP
jgi:hypothetical protein